MDVHKDLYLCQSLKGCYAVLSPFDRITQGLKGRSILVRIVLAYPSVQEIGQALSSGDTARLFELTITRDCAVSSVGTEEAGADSRFYPVSCEVVVETVKVRVTALTLDDNGAYRFRCTQDQSYGSKNNYGSHDWVNAWTVYAVTVDRWGDATYDTKGRQEADLYEEL